MSGVFRLQGSDIYRVARDRRGAVQPAAAAAARGGTCCRRCGSVPSAMTAGRRARPAARRLARRDRRAARRPARDGADARRLGSAALHRREPRLRRFRAWARRSPSACGVIGVAARRAHADPHHAHDLGIRLRPRDPGERGEGGTRRHARDRHPFPGSCRLAQPARGTGCRRRPAARRAATSKAREDLRFGYDDEDAPRGDRRRSSAMAHPRAAADRRDARTNRRRPRRARSRANGAPVIDPALRPPTTACSSATIT